MTARDELVAWALKEFGVSNGTQVWVEFQGSAEMLADAILANWTPQTVSQDHDESTPISMEVLDEYRRIALWLEEQAATRGPVGDTVHGLAAEALQALIKREYARHKIPLYAMLDIWQALDGTSHPEFDDFYAEHGYAETWARLCGEVKLRPALSAIPPQTVTAEHVASIKAEALDEHRRFVVRNYSPSLTSRKSIVADLEDYRDRYLRQAGIEVKS